MNAQQEEWLKQNGVSACYGAIVKDRYGAFHAVPHDQITVGMAGWLYQHGLTGPSPELGKAAVEAILDHGSFLIDGTRVTLN